MYYDRAGQPISQTRWAELFEQDRTIVVTPVGPYVVSTVWLGLDHNWGTGPPLIFETLILGETGPLRGDMRRYSTEAEARTGHAEYVDLARWESEGAERRA